jgi:RimJ/RimL family protein N-acetyltransferase
MSWSILVDETAADEVLAAVSGTPRHHRAMPFFDAEGLLGLFVFERYTGPGGSVVVHWTGLRQNWLRRGMLKAGLWYAFEFLQCERVVGEIPSDNERAIRVARKMGFTPVATLPGYFPAADLGIYYLTRASCRVSYGPPDGQAQTAAGPTV